MEKVRLSLDDLEVQSFATAGPAGEPRGTVRGHDSAPTEPVNCCDCHSGACGGSESLLATNRQ